MRRFIAKTDGPNRLGLLQLCEAWRNDQWVAAHMTPEQAAVRVKMERHRPSAQSERRMR